MKGYWIFSFVKDSIVWMKQILIKIYRNFFKMFKKKNWVFGKIELKMYCLNCSTRNLILGSSMGFKMSEESSLFRILLLKFVNIIKIWLEKIRNKNLVKSSIRLGSLANNNKEWYCRGLGIFWYSWSILWVGKKVMFCFMFLMLRMKGCCRMVYWRRFCVRIFLLRNCIWCVIIRRITRFKWNRMKGKMSLFL